MFKNRHPKVAKTTQKRAVRPALNKPSTFSYYARRSDELLNTGRQLARSETVDQAKLASRYWRQRFGLAILLISAMICLVYISTLTDRPKINIIDENASTSVVLQPIAVYEGAGQTILNSSILNHNKITLSTDDLASKLASRFPELSKVQVSLPPLDHRVLISLASAEPVMLLATSTGTFALDAGGTALLTGSQLSALAPLHLPLVTDESSVKVAVRKQALTSDNMGFILTVVAQLKGHKLDISNLTLPSGSSELDVRLENQPYFVKFNLASKSVRQQVGTFIAVQQRLAGEQVIAKEYIDVRVDGRAYYK